MGLIGKVRVEIDPLVNQKINFFVQKSLVEVSGIGHMIWQDGVLRVISAHLLKQKNSATETDLDPADVAKAMYDLRESPGHLNFWWHSHVNMNVFWSQTDLDTIYEFGKNGMCLATVFNKREERRSAFYQKGTDFFPEIFIDEIPTTVGTSIPLALSEAWNKEFEDKAETKKFIPAIWAGYGAYGAYEKEYNGVDDDDDYAAIMEDFNNQRTDGFTTASGIFVPHHVKGKERRKFIQEEEAKQQERAEDKVIELYGIYSKNGIFTQDEIKEWHKNAKILGGHVQALEHIRTVYKEVANVKT